MTVTRPISYMDRNSDTNETIYSTSLQALESYRFVLDISHPGGFCFPDPASPDGPHRTLLFFIIIVLFSSFVNRTVWFYAKIFTEDKKGGQKLCRFTKSGYGN